MATIRWFNSINGFSVGDELTEVIDTSGNVFTSKITSYVDVDIVSDNGNKIWNFDSTGNLVFPDSTTQTTAYPGTSTSLTLTGNISAGNANLGNLTTSNFFHGVFDNTSSSQPNITNVGNLSNLTVGNATSNVIIIGGNITVSSNIIAYSNIQTTTLRSIFSSNTSNLYTCNIIFQDLEKF